MHPSIRAILAAFATTLALLAALPAGDPGGPKGGSGGVWILPAAASIVDISQNVSSHNLVAATATHRNITLTGDMVFQLDSRLSDQVGVASVENVTTACMANGTFLTIPLQIVTDARSAGVRFVDVIVSDGTWASGIVIEIGAAGAVHIHLF